MYIRAYVCMRACVCVYVCGWWVIRLLISNKSVRVRDCIGCVHAHVCAYETADREGADGVYVGCRVTCLSPHDMQVGLSQARGKVHVPLNRSRWDAAAQSTRECVLCHSITCRRSLLHIGRLGFYLLLRARRAHSQASLCLCVRSACSVSNLSTYAGTESVARTLRYRCVYTCIHIYVRMHV